MWETISNLVSVGSSIAKAVGSGADAASKSLSSDSGGDINALLMKPESFMSAPNVKSPISSGSTTMAGTSGRKASQRTDPLDMARRIAKALDEQ